MKWKEWLDNWSMTGLKINAGLLEAEWQPLDRDRDAAWELYVELLTRIVTQPIASSHGDEATALESIYAVFGLTRDTLKRFGRHCTDFPKLAIVVLNQKVRPFTTKWHRLARNGAFSDATQCSDFRNELACLQKTLRVYTMMLADMAGVEDLMDLARGENVEACRSEWECVQ